MNFFRLHNKVRGSASSNNLSYALNLVAVRRMLLLGPKTKMEIPDFTAICRGANPLYSDLRSIAFRSGSDQR